MFELVIILAVIIAIIAIFIYSIYGRLSKKRALANRRWDHIKSLLVRRADLVPSLIAVIDEYCSNEILVLEYLTESRSLLLNAGTVSENNQANNQLTDSLKHLFEVLKGCSKLNDNEDYQNLRKEYDELNLSINRGRQEYNEAVLAFNNECQSFPNYYFIDLLGFEEKDYFKGYPEFNENSLRFNL